MCLPGGKKRNARLKMCGRKSMPERRKCFSMGELIFSGPVAVVEKRFVAVERNLAGKKGE